ncbi:hypothetical protein RRG08_046775 [Elysia crispata]|uniref:Uncharacterized protein n=1 Tax=Elysia crispata TaxID=231223 RepID=A0AAE0ZUU7_9GAST|nr:hypothetical protein RRG08_046775 [Elysia crispata]
MAARVNKSAYFAKEKCQQELKKENILQLKNSLRDINERIKATEENVGGLRKLQKVFKAKIEALPYDVIVMTSSTAKTGATLTPTVSTLPTLLIQTTVETSPKVTPTALAVTMPDIGSSHVPPRSLSERRHLCGSARCGSERFQPKVLSDPYPAGENVKHNRSTCLHGSTDKGPCTPGRVVVVSDWEGRSLHLVTPDCRQDRKLWSHGSVFWDRLVCDCEWWHVCVTVTQFGET